MKDLKKLPSPAVFRIISAVSFVISAALCIYGYQIGIFSSQERLRDFIDGFGPAGTAVFIIFQAVQVIFPIIPGGIGCLAGVILFGAFKGFLYNYIGICAGSVCAFMIAKHCGKPILQCFFSDKLITKYEKWTSKKGRFTKMFAVAIFLPVAPDDFLCYLAGTTEMKLPVFTTIILLCKPFAIFLYSMGLMAIFNRLPAILGGAAA